MELYDWIELLVKLKVYEYVSALVIMGLLLSVFALEILGKMIDYLLGTLFEWLDDIGLRLRKRKHWSEK